MAADSNWSFQPNLNPASHAAPNQQAISFQSGAVNTFFEMVPSSNYFGENCSVPMAFSGLANIVSNYSETTQANSSSLSPLFDSVPQFNYENGVLPEWLAEEQYILEKGLIKYANEPGIMKYIKIAATLQDKTVRDVALRCKWMMRKRRKPEESKMGKRVKERKGKLVESSPTFETNFPLVSSLNVSPCVGENDFITYEVDAMAKHLLALNVQVFEQIIANFSTYKLEENMDLFCQARTNITAILNDMNGMPGMMSRMQPLRVCLNDDLTDSVLPDMT